MKKVVLQSAGKLVLRDRRLAFVDVGTGKMHIKSIGGPPYNPGIDISSRTIGACDLDMMTGILTTSREVEKDHLCGHCLRTARVYNVQRAPEIWVEEIES